MVGTALMTLGLYLLSRLGVDTNFWLVSLYLFILGVGIGASLQVLIIAVQNAVDYTDLGAATSGVTFFRSIGGSFGTSVFGAIFSGVLAGDIAAALHGVPLPSGLSPSAGASPAVLQHLPASIRDGYIAGYAQALHTVFLFATPLAALGFVLSLFLKEVPLRDTVRAVDRAQSTAPTAIPATRDSAQEMERAADDAVRPGAPGGDLPPSRGGGRRAAEPARHLADVPRRGQRPDHRAGAGRPAGHRRRRPGSAPGRTADRRLRHPRPGAGTARTSPAGRDAAAAGTSPADGAAAPRPGPARPTGTAPGRDPASRSPRPASRRPPG